MVSIFEKVSMKSLSRMMDVPVSTIQGWKERGRIPSWHWKDVLETTKEAGIDVTVEDLVSAEERWDN